MIKYLCTLLLFSVPHMSIAQWTERAALAELFHQAKVDGTFVVRNPKTGELSGYNEKRASTRFVPASTFKIVNTLIGLSLGAVNDVDEMLEYGWHPQPIKEWERDMSLREAIVMSNVAIYQTLARRIGLRRMAGTVELIGYGNKTIGQEVDRFWLDGPLKISANEQVEFLSRLAAHRLPLSETAQIQTQDILFKDKGEGWSLWAKSGWQHFPNAGVGWWVGWVNSAGANYPFALNIDMKNSEMGPTREKLARACLQSLGLLP